jgi:tyrosine-protein phosphatase SIW14
MKKTTLMLFALVISSSAHAIDKFTQVDHALWRGAGINTPADYKLLKSKGIRTIIDLEFPDSQFQSEKSIAKKYGMYDIHYPMYPALYPDEKTVDQLLTLLTDSRYQPVYVHCAQGKDRTGLIMGLYRIHKMGWDKHKAYAEMLSFGFTTFFIPLEVFFWDHADPGELSGPGAVLPQ